MPSILPRIIARIRVQKPDALVVSGDILDVPPEGLHKPAVRATARQDAQAVLNILEGAGCPLWLVPGNHDHMAVCRAVFGGLPRDGVCRGHRFLTFWDQETDFHVPRRLLNERERYLAALNDTGGLPQIHVQHFLIRPYVPGYPHNYAEADSLATQLARSGNVKLVLSGHVHAGTDLMCEQGVWYSSVPALCEAPHVWGLYDLGAHGVTRTLHALGAAFPTPRPAVFLDRDGTISVLPSYRYGPERMRLLPGVAAALRRLRRAGYALVMVSKQSAIGQGYVTQNIVNAVNDRMAELLWRAAKVELDGMYYSMHCRDAVLPELDVADHPDAKPRAGLLQRAARELQLDLTRSYIVGDAMYDLEAGRNANITTILVKTGVGARLSTTLAPGMADIIVDDLPAAVRHILAARPRA